MHIKGAHVDDAVDAVGIKGGTQAENADEGHDGLYEQGDAAHMREAENHAAENDAHPVKLRLHPDDGGLAHEGIFPGHAGRDGGNDQHDPQADAQGHVEAAVAHGGIVGFSHLLELGEYGAENNGAEREEHQREDAGKAGDAAGNGGHGFGHDAECPCRPGDETAGRAFAGSACGGEGQNQAADLCGQHGPGVKAVEGDQACDQRKDGSCGGNLPSPGRGGGVAAILPPGKEGQSCAELGKYGEENKRPVGNHDIPRKVLNTVWRKGETPEGVALIKMIFARRVKPWMSGAYERIVF